MILGTQQTHRPVAAKHESVHSKGIHDDIPIRANGFHAPRVIANFCHDSRKLGEHVWTLSKAPDILSPRRVDCGSLYGRFRNVIEHKNFDLDGDLPLLLPAAVDVQRSTSHIPNRAAYGGQPTIKVCSSMKWCPTRPESHASVQRFLLIAQRFHDRTDRFRSQR